MKKLHARNLLAALFFLFFVMGSSYAQQRVSGTVYDGETNETLIGANVLVNGTTVGTITDIDGSFSINMPEGTNELVVSFAGYSEQVIAVDGRSNIDIRMAAGELLDEIVVVGYGSQSEKEITSSVVSLDAEDFNQGDISDPAQLLQGKVAGLQVYNRGGDPNGRSTIRLRGISTVGANVQPLVVIDGIIGGSLDNVDPNDIETINVLKDGSAAAIYGSRGSSGVIIVTTKKGSNSGEAKFSYNGQLVSASPFNSVAVLDGDAFVAAGGTDLGSRTNWTDEVTRNALSHLHGLAVTGGSGNTTYRISGNIRDVQGVLDNTGFQQFNTRLNLNTKALNDRLSIDFTSSYTNRDQQAGFDEALRYAVLYNPTAPVFGDDSPFPFNSDQFGGYFETLGLFDSFNPVSIIQQNRNDGKRREFNMGALFGYKISDGLTANFRIAQQQTDFSNVIYYPTTSNFNGNATSPLRKGLAQFYNQDIETDLYEGYLNYITDLGLGSLTLTGGYSYQQENFNDNFFQLGDFPNDDLDFSNAIETSQDLQNAGFIAANSNASPDAKIIAFFGRANLNIDDKLFVNASLRREGSTKLGADNRWGLFPALGVGVDLGRMMNLNGFDLFKVRLGYGVTGSLPGPSGLSQETRNIVNGDDGSVSTNKARAANPELKWEEKAETTLGIEVASGRFSGVLDLYTRDIDDFILLRNVDVAVFGVPQRYENVGALNTKGVELALNYDVVQNSNFNWNTGVVLSSYTTTLNEFVGDSIQVTGNLGAPGQNGTNMIRIAVGEEIGQIWGPVYDGVDDNGEPIFADLNGDGMRIGAADQALNPDADFQVLGNGLPDFELGWTNNITIGDWGINAFFRGAFGHSLVNTFRAFYEPRISTQSSYNFVTTELAVDGLTAARYSSLYVEKADFFMLDNLTISRGINLSGALDNARVSLTFRNPFILTSYTGTSPEPSLVDGGAEDNGQRLAGDGNVLAPGIERRNNFFNQRSITFGLNLNF